MGLLSYCFTTIEEEGLSDRRTNFKTNEPTAVLGKLKYQLWFLGVLRQTVPKVMYMHKDMQFEVAQKNACRGDKR